MDLIFFFVFHKHAGLGTFITCFHETHVLDLSKNRSVMSTSQHIFLRPFIEVPYKNTAKYRFLTIKGTFIYVGVVKRVVLWWTLLREV